MGTTLLAILFVFLAAAQVLVAGGFASFGIASRLHVDEAFPRERRSNWCARLIHRNRLNLIISLLGIEMIILPEIGILIARALGGVGPGPHLFWRHGVLPVAAIAAAAITITVAGFGAAARSPIRFARIASYLLLPVFLLLKPCTDLFLRFVSRVFPELPREMGSPFFLFKGAAPAPGSGFIEEHGSRLMHRIREFGVKKVREVMVPRIDIFGVDVHAPLSEVRDLVSSAGHSRVPVYDGTIDRVVGILHVKDLLKSAPEEGVRLDRGRYLKEAHFVPEGKKIDDLLREFQRGKKHMAIVVDEYGGTAGIVTLEDILEEIVGEIRDEYDHEPPPLRQLGRNVYLAEGRIPLDELNAVLKTALPTEDVDTLGGFLYNLIGRVPREGEEVSYDGIQFRISRLDGQRITEVVIRLVERGKEARRA